MKGFYEKKMVYESIFWGLVILSLIEFISFYRNSKIKNKHIVDGLILLLFIVFAGGRICGLDYKSYERYFDESQMGILSIFNNISEPGFILLCKIVPTYRILLFTVAAISVVCIYFSFRKEKCTGIIFMLSLFFATYFLFYNMGVMRQGIAISICLYSLRYIESKDKRFFLLLLVALSFHISSICFLPMYFVGNKKFPKKVYYTILTASLFVSLSGFFFGDFINFFVSKFGGEFLKHKFLVNSSVYSKDSIISLLRRIVFSVFFIEAFTRKSFWVGNMRISRREETGNTWLYINGYVLSTILFTMFGAIGLGGFGGRGTASLYCMFWFLYDQIIYDKKNKNLGLFYFIVFVMLTYESFHSTLYQTVGNTYIPYKFFLQR